MYNVVIIADCTQDIYYTEKCIQETDLPLNVTNKFTESNVAFEFIRNNDIDIVISDITLCDISGLDVARKILKKNFHCMFILVSNSHEFSYEVARDCIDVGVADYLIKPLKKEVLTNSLNRVIEKLQLYEQYYMKPISQPLTNDLSEMSLSETQAEKIYDFIVKNHTETISMSDITSEFYFSESYINKLLVKYKGKSFKRILNDIRIEHAKSLMMKYPQMSISEIANFVGFNNAHYFSRVYKAYTGLSPSYDRAMKIESIQRT